MPPAVILPWPFVKIVLPFVAGAALAFGLSPEPSSRTGWAVWAVWLVAWLIPAGWLLIFERINRAEKHFSLRKPLYHNLALIIGLVALGYVRALSHLPAHSAHLREALFSGIVKEQPEPKERSVQVTLTLDWTASVPGETEILSAERSDIRSELWRIYLAPDSAARTLFPGDRILFRANPSKLTNEGNPFAFKAGTYALRKGYNATAFVPSGQWRVIGRTHRYRARRSALQFREKWLNQMRSDGVAERDVSLIAALSLGHKERLSEEVRNHFSVTGLAHLLAVSGMNTVLVIAFPLWLLQKWKRRRFITLWLTLATLLLLWAYAYVVGLSPSVCRSVTMFSLLLLGKGLRKKGQAANMLAASAFLWLWCSPLLLFDTGFLLSHLAVASILCFYTPAGNRNPLHAPGESAFTKETYNPPPPDDTNPPMAYRLRQAIRKGVRTLLSKLLSRCAALLHLTLSVQPGTLPLSVALFGIHPLWLLPANLWAVPLVSLIVYGTLLHGLFAWLGPFRRWLAQGISHLVQLLYTGIEQMASWPGTQKQVYLSPPLLFAVWGIVFCLAWLKHSRRKGTPLIVGLSLAIVALCMTIAEGQFRIRPKGFILYASEKGAFAHFLKGSDQIIYSHDTTAIARKEQKRLTDPVARRYRLEETTCLTASDSLFHDPFLSFARNGPLMQMGNRLLVFCHTYPSPFADEALPAPFSADILWIGTDSRHNMAQLCRNLHPTMVVIAKNIPLKTQRAWENTCKANHVEVFVQQRDGAFIAIEPCKSPKSPSYRKKR